MSANVSEEFSKIQSEIYHHGYNRGYKQGRADAIDEFITLAKNGISLYDIEKLLKEQHKCGTCTKYADLHSSCELVRDFKVNADTTACVEYKGEKL